MSSTSLLKEEHDELLAKMPEGAAHPDVETCVWCNPTLNQTPGGDMKTYSEEELVAAVNEAVTPLKAELDRINAQSAEGEVEAKIAAAKAEVEGQLTEVQNKLDAADAAKTAAEDELTKVMAWLQTEADAAAETARLEGLKTTRRDAVKAVASFTDEQLDAKLDRWVAMDDESFETFVEGLKDVAAAAPAAPILPTFVPVDTAMSTTRTPTGATSAVSDLFGLMRDGVDPRTL
jgi:hypothetical protein